MFKIIDEISKERSEVSEIISVFQERTGMSKREATEWVKAWIMK